jgi:hypothetical protein
MCGKCTRFMVVSSLSDKFINLTRNCKLILFRNIGLHTSFLNAATRNPNTNLADYCSTFSGLTSGQIKLCQLYSDHLSAISKGARVGIVECQWQFRSNQWNCSSSSNQSIFGSSIETYGKYIYF